jgi:hypothetical protein
VGGVRVDAQDPVNGAQERDRQRRGRQGGFVDVTLKGFGTINLRVDFARGLPAPSAYVSYSGDRGGAVYMDGGGRASLSLPVGHYTFYAAHPEESGSGLGDSEPAAIATNGQVGDVVRTLKPAGAGRARSSGPTGPRWRAVSYTVRSPRLHEPGEERQTSSTGVYCRAGWPRAWHPHRLRSRPANADQEFQLPGRREVQLDLRVEDNRIAPRDLATRPVPFRRAAIRRPRHRVFDLRPAA